MNNAPIDVFANFKEIFKTYDSTRLYRDLKIKGFITQNKELLTFPDEQIKYKSLNNMNIVNDQPIQGKFLSF